MKKFLLAVSVLLALNLLGGCSKPRGETQITPELSISPTEGAITPYIETDPAVSTMPPLPKTEDNPSSDSVDAAYAQQIERYYAAITNHWDKHTYFDHEMSAPSA